MMVVVIVRIVGPDAVFGHCERDAFGGFAIRRFALTGAE